MFAAGLWLFVAVACLVALHNWRWGLLLCVVAGLLQDPIRKVTPGTPGYFILASVPIYAAAGIHLMTAQPAIQRFFRHFPLTLFPTQLFLVALIASSVQTLGYGLSAAPLILLGGSFYVGWCPAVLLGFFLLRKDFAELDRPLTVVGALISLMLIGVFLEYAGVEAAAPWLGTVAMEQEWRRWTDNGQWIVMRSGFFRAPEIMGWHAATLVILSVYLLARRPAFALLWLAQAACGLACVALSGRRKMFILILLFSVLFALLTRGPQRRRILVYLVLAALAGGFGMTYAVDDDYVNATLSAFDSAGSRVSTHYYEGPLWLLGIVGPFGYGLGTKSQGAQHLAVSGVETPLVEGGFEKVLVELGIVGAAAALYFVATLFRLGYREFQRFRKERDHVVPEAALGAFILANVMAFLVAFQVYGDPLIGSLLGFSIGLVLSGKRLALQRQALVTDRARALPETSAA